MMHDRSRGGILQREGPAVLVVLAALAVRFHRLVLEGVTLLNDEMADEYYPTAAHVFALLRRRELPLWSPEILFGYPLAVTVDLHLFSPFAWAHWLLPPHVALGLQLLSVQLVLALALYALARGFEVSPFGSAGAAIFWAAGCPADNLLLISMGQATVPWIPLVALAAHRYVLRGDLRWAVAAGGALGLALLGGHVQFVYWTVIFVAAYLLFVARPDTDGWAHARRTAKGLLVMGAVGGALAAVTVLPMRTVLQDSVRASLAWEQRIHTGTLSFDETVRALRWTLFCGRDHNRVEGDIEFRAVGVLPVALALLAVGRGRRRDNRLLALGLVFLVLSLGAVFAPSHALVKMLPGNHFRYPSRIALFFTLPVVLLAGRGIDRWLSGDARRTSGVTFWAILAVLALPGLWSLLHSPGRPEISEGVRGVVALVAVGVGLAVHGRGPAAMRLRHAAAVAALAVFAVHSGLMAYAIERSELARWGGTRAGIWSFRRGQERPHPPAELSRVPRRDAHGPTRMLYVDMPWEHNLPLLTGHHTPMGLVSLRPARVDQIIYARYRASDPESSLADTLLPRQNLLDLFNVQYVVLDPARFERYFDAAQRESSMTLGPSLGHLALAENRTHLPRSFFLARATGVRSGEEARRAILSRGFDPRRDLLLETDEPLPAPAPGAAPFRPARVIAYANESVAVRVDAPQAGWVVLLDRWAPGWSARVDGRAVPIRRANYLFRAVPVPIGPHTVVFAYDDPSFRQGLFVSALGAVAVLAAGLSLLRDRG